MFVCQQAHHKDQTLLFQRFRVTQHHLESVSTKIAFTLPNCCLYPATCFFSHFYSLPTCFFSTAFRLLLISNILQVWCSHPFCSFCLSSKSHFFFFITHLHVSVNKLLYGGFMVQTTQQCGQCPQWRNYCAMCIVHGGVNYVLYAGLEGAT